MAVFGKNVVNCGMLKMALKTVLEMESCDHGGTLGLGCKEFWGSPL